MTAPITAAAMSAPGVTPTDDPRDVARRMIHPLVCTHPETGRKCLYLGRRRNAYIDGPAARRNPKRCSTRFGLTRRATSCTWYNDWRVGDLVLWDNRCTMHRRDPFDPAARRVMHRTQIKGETRPAA